MDDLNRPYRRDRTSALAVIFNSSLTGFQVALGAIMPIVRDDLHMSLTIASLHFTIMAIAGMIASHLTSRVAGRYGRRRVVYVSLTLVNLGLLAFCLAPSVIVTLAAAVVIGISGQFGTILTQSEVMDHHQHHRATATAELSLIISGFMLLTTLGAGPLVKLTDSWRLVLIIPTVMLAGTYLVIRPVRFSDGHPGRIRHSTGTMNGLAWLFCVLIISQTAFEWCYGYLGAEFMDKAGGLSKSSAAGSMALYYCGLVLGRFFLVPAVRKFSALQLLTTSFSVALVGFLLLASGPNPEIKCAGLFVSGLGISLTFPMIATLAAGSFPNATDWIISRIFTAGGLAVAVAPFVIGTLGDAVGIGISFWVVGALGSLGLLAAPLLPRMRKAASDAALQAQVSSA
jgi:predicted MFS family arabinose efflux permease